MHTSQRIESTHCCFVICTLQGRILRSTRYIPVQVIARKRREKLQGSLHPALELTSRGFMRAEDARRLSREAISVNKSRPPPQWTEISHPPEPGQAYQLRLPLVFMYNISCKHSMYMYSCMYSNKHTYCTVLFTNLLFHTLGEGGGQQSY